MRKIMFEDFEIIIGNEDEKPPFIIKPLDENALLHEIAIHEASHFVFALLLENLDLGFLMVSHIIIEPEQIDQEGKITPPQGEVGGFGASVPYIQNTLEHDPDELKNWYLEDPRRIWGNCLQAVAGFTSYRVFFDEDEYFIGYPYSDNIPGQEIYYTIKSVYLCIPDIKKIRRYLHYTDVTHLDDFKNYLQNLSNKAKEIIKIPKIKEAIEQTTNLLLSKVGFAIEEEELIDLRQRVTPLLEGISLTEVIEGLINEHENNSKLTNPPS